MTDAQLYALLIAAAFLLALPGLRNRWLLSRAKHPSLAGHPRMARRLASLVPFYEYDDDQALRCDGAPDHVARARRDGVDRLRKRLLSAMSRTSALSAAAAPSVSDMQFVAANRVPFQFRGFAGRNFRVGSFADASAGVRIRDLDGNWHYDLSGSYGVNLLGYDFYKTCVDRGIERTRALGPVLGPYHPVLAENAAILKQLSGMDEVSFHMSGTEAVMQAVRLARFHTGRPRLVMFCGAYHGWWDGVQAGPGNERLPADVLLLRDMSDGSLKVLERRGDIACVLVNPLQALHPNATASGDAMLVNSERRAHFDRASYSAWLRRLRTICNRRSIALIFDEVFVGFRLGTGGAQAYFGVDADLVTYGKTLGGGLPVGVVCGKAPLMKRFSEDHPARICFARGTFNSHPYVMGAMNEFLRYVTRPEVARELEQADELWNARARRLNERLDECELPVRLHNLSSIFIVTFTAASRYNWMLQYYLRAEGLLLSWVGSGRLIFSHCYTEEAFLEVAERFVRAVSAMQSDGWWWRDAALNDRAIKRRVLREMLREALGRRFRRTRRVQEAGRGAIPPPVDSTSGSPWRT